MMRYSFLFFIVFFYSCSVIKESSKYQFSEGVYNTHLPGKHKIKAYVNPYPDSIRLYPSYRKGKDPTPGIDTSILILLPAEAYFKQGINYHFVRTSFDIDVLTILFRFRPSLDNFPMQLNTNFNGNVYIGYRWDRYSIKYKSTAANIDEKRISHLGYSAGFFIGIGATAINPWVTNNHVNSEYDGVIYSRGFAFLIALDNLTFGLGLGWDNLLDQNKKKWMYQNKPWIGLALGLNLN